jgi:hypothetical protein
MKYTREVLQEAVRECVSVAGVLRKLGVAQAGGTHSHISRRIKAFGIDVSHFLGQGANQGQRHRGGSRSLDWQELLVLREDGRRQKSHILRRALLQMGRDYRCQGPGCQIGGAWLARRIMLHVNHRNGNWLDDRPENLELLCPNCHSQTANYCGSKGFSDLTTQARWHREYRRRKHGLVAELVYAGGLGPPAQKA